MLFSGESRGPFGSAPALERRYWPTACSANSSTVEVRALVWGALPLNQNTWALDHWINELPLCSVEASRVVASLGSLIVSQSDPERKMTRLIAIAFTLAVASSAEGMPLQPQELAAQPDEILTLVREACGPGMQRVNGVCRRNTAVRRACAAALRLVNGRCLQ